MRHMIYQVKLNKGELWNPSLEVERENLRILEGKAWVTIKGSPHDFILSAGEPLPQPLEGVLVESLTAELVLQGDFTSTRSRK